MTLLPDGIPLAVAAFLVALSCLTSLLTAAVGIGGGVTLLAAMTLVLPAAALIPVHGVVQLGSNFGRSLLLARDAAPRLLVPFAAGALVGAGVGALLVTDLPAEAITLSIGVFVLVTTWVKLPPLGRGERGVLAGGGFVATVLTMFVGATGPFVMALMRQGGLPHRRLVATTTVAMTLQHSLKVAAFAALGFAFADWAPLMAAMIASGFVGTSVGARLLDRLPEPLLSWALKGVLTVIGVELVLSTMLDTVR